MKSFVLFVNKQFYHNNFSLVCYYNLQSSLDIEMHGIQRMPALLIKPSSSLETSNL